ncbi:MAG TPA: hypothetical protein VFW27_20760, partial [Actinoplanes sp.]|nr:hypothetical protein [Actinoplanes sp.]
NAQLEVGRARPARGRAEAAVTIWQRIGSPYWLAQGLETLADTLLVLGDAGRADEVRSRASGLGASCRR